MITTVHVACNIFNEKLWKINEENILELMHVSIEDRMSPTISVSLLFIQSQSEGRVCIDTRYIMLYLYKCHNDTFLKGFLNANQHKNMHFSDKIHCYERA